MSAENPPPHQCGPGPNRRRVRSVAGTLCRCVCHGYIDALHDEQAISIDGAQLYREDVQERRRSRLAEFGVELDEREG